MSGSSDGARIPARDLWVRLRADGRVLLELVGRRDVRLCSAVSIAEGAEEIAEILVSWACDAGGPGGTWSPELLQADAEAFSRRSHRALFISDQRNQEWNRARLLPAKDEHGFAEFFGAVRPTDRAGCEEFCRKLADAVRTRCRSGLSLAEQRLAGGAYRPVLESYVDQLRGLASDQQGYHRVPKELQMLVHDEGYLFLAEDVRVRRLMAEFYEVLEVMYQQSQDLDRAGIAGLRDLPPRRRNA